MIKTTFLILLLSSCLSAQSLEAYLNFGATTTLSSNLDEGGSLYARSKKPSIKAFIGVVLKSELDYISTDYALSLSIYSKGLGNNQNALYTDIQIDFVNSLSVGLKLPSDMKHLRPHFFYEDGQGFNHERIKPIRTLNNSGFYGILNRYTNSIYMSTNFILNNHKRNQIVGAFALTFHDVTIQYYNDGTIPFFDLFGLNDRFDRWWTGGGGLYIHRTGNDYNLFEFTFDQFTGYAPLMFELTSILGIDIPPYGTQKSSEKINKRLYNFSDSDSAFNSSMYNIRVNFNKGFGVDFGVSGNLRSSSGKIWGIQDMIHLLRDIPLHPNNTSNKLHLGLTYTDYYALPPF